MANAALFQRELLYFKAAEFKHPELMDTDFLRWLDAARALAQVPFIVTSDARSATENAAVGGWDKSLHLLGRAVDLRWPRKRSELIDILHGLLLMRRTAPGLLQIELEVTPGNEHIHVGVYPQGSGVDEFFVVCEHQGS